MKLKWKLLNAIMINLLIISAYTLAKEKTDENKVHQLDDIIVSTPAIIDENEVNRLGSQITHVTQEQISDLNAMDLTSALRRVPGIVISRHNLVGSFGGGEGGALFIRGNGSSRPGAEIQTLIDGIPKFVSVWTHPLMDVLNVDIVDTIDIYKGAQPVLFGNMAFGAVDIRSKHMKDKGFYTSIHSAYGSNNTVASSIENGGKFEKFDYYILGGYRGSDGHRENADGELQDIFCRLGYDFTDKWRIDFTLIHTDNWADDPGPVDGSAPSDGRFNNKDTFAVATLSNSHDWGTGYIKFYNDKGDIDWVNQQGTLGLDTITDYRNYGIRARETFNPWENGEIIIGMDLDFISGEAQLLNPIDGDAFFPKETFRIISPYMALSHMFGNSDGLYFIPSIGVRYLNHNVFDSETAPQAGLVLGYRDTKVHTSYGKGINYPGIYTKLQDTLWMLGENLWEELNAEKLNHFEVGIEHKFNKYFLADLTWFYDDGEDRIVTSPPPPFPAVLTNIGEYKHKGVEGNITVVPATGLSVFGGFTYLDTDPSDLPYSPEWTFSTGVNYRFMKNFQISIDAQYVDDQFVTSRARQRGTVNVDQVDSYFLVNGKISYDFSIPDSDMDYQVYLAVENITDTDYEQKKGYPMPDLSAMVGFVVTFK